MAKHGIMLGTGHVGKKLKVVNIFDGVEYTHCSSMRECEKIRNKLIKDYYSVPGRENDYFRLAIVPADAKSRWDERRLKYVWVKRAKKVPGM